MNPLFPCDHGAATHHALCMTQDVVRYVKMLMGHRTEQSHSHGPTQRYCNSSRRIAICSCGGGGGGFIFGPTHRVNDLNRVNWICTNQILACLTNGIKRIFASCLNSCKFLKNGNWKVSQSVICSIKIYLFKRKTRCWTALLFCLQLRCNSTRIHGVLNNVRNTRDIKVWFICVNALRNWLLGPFVPKQASIFICPINKQRYNIDE